MKDLKDKTYRLADNRSGESFMVKVGRKGRLTIFDEDKGTRRAIRHCPNQPSIFVDEQDKHARVTPIIFTNGYLEVDFKNPITQAFLDAHPSNVANGGNWFEFIDDELEATENIELEDLQVDLKTAVRKAAKAKDGFHKLMAEAAVYTGSIDKVKEKSIPELKQLLYNAIDSNPYYFADDSGKPTIFNDDITLRKYLVLKSLKDGIIKKSANTRTIVWGNDKSTIVSAPVGVDLVDYFTDYLSSDEGMLVLEEIMKRS